MKSATTLAGTMAFLFLLGMQGKLLASTVWEFEPNNTIAGAQNVDASFSVVSDPNVFQSATVPHVTIPGTGEGTYDYYSFTVTAAGVLGTFDIDNANFDTELFLYDTAGNLLASNDDNGGDPGSVSAGFFDSLIQNFSFSGPGTFVIGVGQFDSYDSGTGAGIAGHTPETATFYDLHISLDTSAVSGGLSGGLKVRGAKYSVNFTRRSQGAGPNVDNFEFQGKVNLDALVTAGVDLRNLAAAPVSASLAGVAMGLALPVITRPRLVVWRTVGSLNPFLQVTFNPVSGAYHVLVRGVDLDGAVGFPTGGAASMISLSAALTIGPWSDSALLKTTYRMFQGANTIGWGNFHFGQAAFDLPNGIFFVERARILQRKIGGVRMQRALVTVCFLPPDGVASDPSGGVGALLTLGAFSEDVGGAGTPANFVANPAGNMFTYRRPLSAGRTGVARMVINLRRWKMTAVTHWMPAAASPFGIAQVLNPATDPRGSVVFAVGMSLTATYNASVLTGRAGVNFLSGIPNALP